MKKIPIGKLVAKTASGAKAVARTTLSAARAAGRLATSDTAAFMLNDSQSYADASGYMQSKVHAEETVEHLKAEYRAALAELQLRVASAQSTEQLQGLNVLLVKMGLGSGMTGPDFSTFNFHAGLAGVESKNKRLLNDEELRKLAKEIDIQINARLKAMRKRHDFEERLRQDNARKESGGSAGADSKRRKHAKSSKRKYGFKSPP